MPKVYVSRLAGGEETVSRKKKPKQATYPDQDVDHNRPSLEREIEMLREENVRLIGKVRCLQAQLNILDYGANLPKPPVQVEKTPLQMLLETHGTKRLEAGKYYHVFDDALPATVEIDGKRYQILGQDPDDKDVFHAIEVKP
jgi:hypothetical protein